MGILSCLFTCIFIQQWCSQSAEKVTHIKGRLLYQAVSLYNYVPFQIGTSLKGQNAPIGSKFFPLRAVPC